MTPFPVDPAAAARLAVLAADAGDELEARVQTLTWGGSGAFVGADDVMALVDAFGLRSPREAALLSLSAAATIARPLISGYRVGAVGLTTGGDLVLGGNLEFPGASIHHTVHAEGFVTLRTRALGLRLAELAISQARPCAHCRQVLAEMAWADGLRLVDPLGHDLALWDLYPWPFVPGDLGRGASGAADAAPPHLHAATDTPAEVAAAIARACERTHAPYSGIPAAVVLQIADGRLVDGAVLESVAFNPTIGPLQDALVALAAAGTPFVDVQEAWLATGAGASADHVGPTRGLLAAVAPAAPLHVTYWS